MNKQQTRTGVLRYAITRQRCETRSKKSYLTVGLSNSGRRKITEAWRRCKGVVPGCPRNTKLQVVVGGYENETAKSRKTYYDRLIIYGEATRAKSPSIFRQWIYDTRNAHCFVPCSFVKQRGGPIVINYRNNVM